MAEFIGLNHEDVRVILLIIESLEAAHFYLMLQVQCRFQHLHDGYIHNNLDWMADCIGLIWSRGRKLLQNIKTKLRVVWIVYDLRCTPLLDALTGLLTKVDLMNDEKTHVFLPSDHSLELCQTEQQDNVIFDLVEVSFPRVLRLR